MEVDVAVMAGNEITHRYTASTGNARAVVLRALTKLFAGAKVHHECGCMQVYNHLIYFLVPQFVLPGLCGAEGWKVGIWFVSQTHVRRREIGQ